MTFYDALEDREPTRILPHSNRPDADLSGRFHDDGFIPSAHGVGMTEEEKAAISVQPGVRVEKKDV